MQKPGAHAYLTAMDGALIPIRIYGNEDAQAALVVAHGAGPYSLYYEALGAALAQRGIATLSFDQRGFGETAGLRGHENHFSKYLDDCAIALSAAAARWPHAAIGLCGHSFGGLIALRYCSDAAARRGPPPAFLVLIAPWIKDTLPVPASAVAGGMFNALARPTKLYRVPITVRETVDPANAAVREACERDPLWVHDVSARWFSNAARAKVGIFSAARKLELPILQIEGTRDRLVDPRVNRRLFASFGSERKQLVMLENFYHDAQLQRDLDPLVRSIAQFVLPVPEAVRA
ncbi:MAG TPA: alpha/beta fold hydrolase [Candidatus Eremiobacteraceae bacterium]|nr:alpha/beta fold hydrolase [Candidatus Eremiobacteraceae bacterium]